MNKERFFIAAGPPKTGTTWLYANLKMHPQVGLPRDKEIKYFWAKQQFGTNTLSRNLFGQHPHFRSKRTKFVAALKEHFVNRRFCFDELAWDIRYFAGTQTKTWYEGLFDNSRLSGDISPRYCELTDASVAAIKRDYPAARIIISLRDPVERAWSRVRMHLMRDRRQAPDAVDAQSIRKHVCAGNQVSVSDYVGLVERWRRHFGDDQVLVFFFEELQDHPDRLMDRICDFLGIDRITLHEVGRKVNAGLAADIPSQVLKFLVDVNYPFIENMQDYFDNTYVKSWADKYANLRLGHEGLTVSMATASGAARRQVQLIPEICPR